VAAGGFPAGFGLLPFSIITGGDFGFSPFASITIFIQILLLLDLKILLVLFSIRLLLESLDL